MIQLEFAEIDKRLDDGVDASVTGSGFSMDVESHQLEDGEEDILEIRLVLVVHIIGDACEDDLYENHGAHLSRAVCEEVPISIPPG